MANPVIGIDLVLIANLRQILGDSRVKSEDGCKRALAYVAADYGLALMPDASEEIPEQPNI